MWNDFQALHSNFLQLHTCQIDSPPPHNLGACLVVFQLHLTGQHLVPGLSLSYWNPIIATIKTPIIYIITNLASLSLAVQCALIT